MQGATLAKAIEEQWGQRPWWHPDEREMRINCPFCQETDHKCYVLAYHQKEAKGTTYAGSWFCFKGRSAECCAGGSLRDLLPDQSWGRKRPKYTDRSEETGPALHEIAQKAKQSRGWFPPGETVNLKELEKNHPAYLYWHNRYFNPHILGEFYGVEYCFISGGSYQTPEQRRSFDRQGWLSASDHYIFPVIMFGKKIGWQARARGTPAPLLWHSTKKTEENERPIGYWQNLPPEYPWQETELRNPETGKSKKLLIGKPGDTLDRPPKYFHFFDKREALGNFDLARQFKTCVVTEGWTKAIRVGKCGLVTFGKMLTEQQLRMIATYWDRVILLLDRDGANLYEDQMHRKTGVMREGLVTRLRDMTEVHAVTLDKYDDPGDAPHQEIWRQIWQKTGIREPKGNADI